MSALPGDVSVPTRLDLPSGVHLRPLVSSDADLLHPAIGDRRDRLAALLPDGDPSGLPSASPGDDQRALARLEAEARERRLFVYLLVPEDGMEALGAVSVRPESDRAATASWWVVTALLGSRVEEELDAYVRRWLHVDWPFDELETPDNHPEDPPALAGSNLLPLLPDAPVRTPLPDPDLRSAAELWEEYRGEATGLPVALPPVESFGDSVEMADELLSLVRRGVKTATASSRTADPAPEPGDHWIVCDGTGGARLVLRTVEVRVGPLESVDAAFAWSEGEGDRSRDSWLEGHRRYFARECPEGVGEIVFERFVCVWPEEDAGRAAGFARSPASAPPTAP